MSTGQRASHRLLLELRPEALGLMIVEKHVAFMQQPGDAKGQFFVVDRAVVHDAAGGQRSIGHRDRLVA